MSSDEIIESVTKMTIPEIFAAEGEDGFREVETSVLAEVAAYKKCVVATGGGIIKRRENWMHLRNGVVMCLSGPADLLARRIVVGYFALQKNKNKNTRVSPLYSTCRAYPSCPSLSLSLSNLSLWWFVSLLIIFLIILLLFIVMHAMWRCL